MEVLSNLQQDLYRHIKRFILRNGYSPSEQELTNTLTEINSRRTLRQNIDVLINANYIKKAPTKKRNLVLVDGRYPIRELPILAQITAGKPYEALESDQVLNLSELLLGANRYVLQVMGDSMSGDNICDGDYILCERTSVASDEQIVVALINGKETTLKRMQENSDGTVTLLSSNPDIPPMLYPSADVEIQGVYLGLIRLS